MLLSVSAVRRESDRRLSSVTLCVSLCVYVCVYDVPGGIGIFIVQTGLEVSTNRSWRQVVSILPPGS